MVHIKITRTTEPQEVFYLSTKNRNINQFMYVWKRRNKPTYSYRTEIVEELPINEDSFENKYKELIEYVQSECKNVNTCKGYLRQIKRYVEGEGNLVNFEQIKEYFDKLPDHTKETFCYAMVKCSKFKKDEELVRKVVELGRVSRGVTAVERISAMNKPTDKVTMTMDELKVKAAEVPASKKTHKLIAELYCLEAWRGTTVVNLTKNKKRTENGNIIYLVKRKITFNNYKTKHLYGQKDVEISKELASLFKKHFKSTGKDDLLAGMTESQLSKIVNEIFGIGIKELRHVHLTHGRKNLSDIDFVRLCHRMNTSPQTGLTVYNDSKK